MHPEQHPASPTNYTRGRDGSPITGIVLHVMDGTLTGTDAWFANPKAKVSAHYGVGRHGEIHQYVDEADTAWHAGDWGVNLSTIGIEHEGRQNGGTPYWAPTLEQLLASVRLAASICHRHGIAPDPDTLLRHSEINPDHALCPGPGFPLELYIGMTRELIEGPLRLGSFRPLVTHAPDPHIDDAVHVASVTVHGSSLKLDVRKEKA